LARRLDGVPRVVVLLLVVLLPALGQRAWAQRPDLPAVPPGLARLVPPTPAPAGFIADPRDVLPAADEARLNAEIRALQASGAGDIGVAILPSLEDRAPVEVAVAIYRAWRIGRIDSLGSARRNLGALLLIVPKELAPDHRGECWISSGTGAEGALTDALSARICRDSIIPHLRERDYAGAVGAGVQAIAARLGSEVVVDSSSPAPVEAPEARRRGGALWYLLGALGGGVLGLVGAAQWRRRHPRDCHVCGQRMQRLSEQADDAALDSGQRVEESLHSVDYDVWQCPGGHTLVLPYKARFTPYRTCRVCHVRAERTTRQVLQEPTYLSTGLAEDTRTCKACGATRTVEVTLARRTPPSSGSSGGSSGGGGGGGGFGGSGSTSGGGGGSSY
jgi:uncharacterized protein